MVNIPSFIVRLDSQKHIDFSLRSPYGGGRQGNSSSHGNQVVYPLLIECIIIFYLMRVYESVFCSAGRVKRKNAKKGTTEEEED